MKTPSPELLAALAAGALLIAGGWLAWRRWRGAAARRAQWRAIQSVAHDALRDVLVPDGSGGTLHVDFLLLTGRGLLVVDFRDVAGAVFGGEHMNDWTVMDGTRRHTFPNPLGPLLDRIAAVKLASGESAVEGRVVFTERSQFPKGRPPQVLLLASLQAEFPAADRDASTAAADGLRAGWDKLKAQCAPSPLGRR